MDMCCDPWQELDKQNHQVASLVAHWRAQILSKSQEVCTATSSVLWVMQSLLLRMDWRRPYLTRSSPSSFGVELPSNFGASHQTIGPPINFNVFGTQFTTRNGIRVFLCWCPPSAKVDQHSAGCQLVGHLQLPIRAASLGLSRGGAGQGQLQLCAAALRPSGPKAVRFPGGGGAPSSRAFFFGSKAGTCFT